MTTSTTTSQNPLWDLQSRYLPSTFEEARRQYNLGPQAPYAGPRVAGFDPIRAQGINRALGAADGSQQALSNAYTGGILDIAQGTDAGTQRLAQQAATASSAPFADAGTLGSARSQLASNRAASDAILGRQLQALSQIPSAQQAALAPAETYTRAGKTVQDYQQQLIDADRGYYGELQAAPSEHLTRYQTALGFPGVNAPTTTTSTTRGPSIGDSIQSAIGSGVGSIVGGVVRNVGSSILGGLFAEGGEVPAEQPKMSRYEKAKMKKMGV